MKVDSLSELTIRLEKDPEEGGWFVSVVELPGCMSQGDTVAQALSMIQEAIGLWLNADQDGSAANVTEFVPATIEGLEGEWVTVAHLAHRLHVDCAKAWEIYHESRKNDKGLVLLAVPNYGKEGQTLLTGVRLNGETSDEKYPIAANEALFLRLVGRFYMPATEERELFR